MNPDRRRVLQVLGLGTVGSLAGCSLLESDSAGGGGGPEDDGDDDQSNGGGGDGTFDKAARIESSLQGQAPTRPEFDFEYEPVAADLEDSDLFASVQAQPAAGAAGDYLQFRPATQSARELAGLLRDLWNVGTDTTATAATGAGEVELTGGEAFGTVVLVGVARFERTATVAVRARDRDTAATLAADAPFSLDADQ